MKQMNILHYKVETGALQKYVMQQGSELVLLQEPWLSVVSMASGGTDVFSKSKTNLEHVSLPNLDITFFITFFWDYIARGFQ